MRTDKCSRGGQRLEMHYRQAREDRWKRALATVKGGEFDKMPMHPVAKVQYLRFLDLTED